MPSVSKIFIFAKLRVKKQICWITWSCPNKKIFCGNYSSGLVQLLQWFGPTTPVVWSNYCSGLVQLLQWFGPTTAVVWSNYCSGLVLLLQWFGPTTPVVWSYSSGLVLLQSFGPTTALQWFGPSLAKGRHHQYLRTCSIATPEDIFLVGGWVSTHLKHMLVKLDQFPSGGENAKYVKPPTRFFFWNIIFRLQNNSKPMRMQQKIWAFFETCFFSPKDGFPWVAKKKTWKIPWLNETPKQWRWMVPNGCFFTRIWWIFLFWGSSPALHFQGSKSLVESSFFRDQPT